MPRLTLIYGDQEIEMPRGESYVGRAVECQLRFNDAAISRRHLRFLCKSEGIYLENLSATNGTELNGTRLSRPVRVDTGDVILIGHRRLGIRIDSQPHAGDSASVTISGPLEVGPGLLMPDESDPSDAGNRTRPGTGPAGFLAGISSGAQRNCPKCRARVASQELQCQTCGYEWPFGGPASPTQEINVSELMRRAARRHIIRVPVIYSSEYLTLDCMARDLSEGGMYIASEILDPVGTLCDITALPDGRAALRFEAEVCHVSTKIVHGRPPGFGVQFSTMSEPASEWLSLVTARKD